MIRSKIVDKLVLGVQQLHFDRTLVFAIGARRVEFYLIVELYGKGNLVLTDEKFTILALQNATKQLRVGVCYMDTAGPSEVTFQTIVDTCNFGHFQKCIANSFNAKGQQS